MKLDEVYPKSSVMYGENDFVRYNIGTTQGLSIMIHVYNSQHYMNTFNINSN